MIFPSLFVLIFIVSSLITGYFNNKNKELLIQTENEILPRIEISIELSHKLEKIQRSLQDAVAAADSFKLEEADTLANQLKIQCELLRQKTGSSVESDSILKHFDTYYSIAKEVSIAMIGGSFSEELSSKMPQMLSLYNQLATMLTTLTNSSKIQAEEHFEIVNQNRKQSTNTYSIIVGIGVVIFILVSLLLSKAIVAPIKEVVSYLRQISHKEIYFEITENRKDEIGNLYKSINEINKNFKQIIYEINEASSTVLSSGNQLTAIAQQIAQSSGQQAASTEEISSSSRWWQILTKTPIMLKLHSKHRILFRKM